MFDKLNLNSLFDFVDTSAIQPAITALSQLNTEYSKLSRNLVKNSKNLETASSKLTAALLANQAALQSLNITTAAGQAQVVSVTVAVGQQARAYGQNQAALKGLQGVQKTVLGSLGELTQKLKFQRAEFDKLSATQAQDTVALFKLAKAILQTTSDMDELRKAARGVNSEFTASAGSYNNLKLQTEGLVAQLKALPQGMANTTAQAKQLKQQIAENRARMAEFTAETRKGLSSVGAHAQSIINHVKALQTQKKELLEARSALERAIKATDKGSAAHNDYQKELDETNAKLKNVNNGLSSYGQATSAAAKGTSYLQSSLKSYLSFIGLAYFSLQALQQVIGQVFTSNVKYSDSLVAVQKTTGLAAAETEVFVDALKAIPTRTSLSGLLDIAKVGGQMGVVKEDILGFTAAVDVAVNALSDDFEGGAEAIATALGKINAIFKTSEDVGIEEALLNIGSAVNQLAASGIATAPFLTDYARRVGAIASNAGLALGPVFAMGAALEELGFTSEVAGTATNRLISGLTTKPEEFFAIAKLGDATLTLKQFKNLINTDIKAALDVFLKGLNAGGGSTTKFAALIKSLGLKSGEAVSVLTALSRNIDTVADRLVVANKELEKGTSLAKEAELRNNNLAGSYEKIKNKLVNLATNSAITRFFKDALDFAAGGILESLGEPNAKPVRDYVKEIVASGVAAKKSAEDAKVLVEELAKLNSIRVGASFFSDGDKDLQEKYPNLIDAIAAKAEKLKAIYGQNSIVLDKQTGSYNINTDATFKNIKASETAFEKARVGISKQLQDLEKLIVAKEDAMQAGGNAEQAQRNIAKEMGITPETIQEIYDYLEAKREFDNENKFTRALKQQTVFGTFFGGRKPEAPEDVTPEQISRVEALNDAFKENVKTSKELQTAYLKKKQIIENLGKLGLTYAQALRYTTAAEKDAIAVTDEAEESDKKAAKAKGDLAHAQYELLKAQAEQRAQGYERQAANVANGEAVITRAIAKASAERKYIARLDANEGIRLSKIKNKEIINGQAIFNTESATLSVQLQTALKKISYDQLKDTKELQSRLLDAAGNTDKLILAREIYLLEQIQQNELLSYEERTQAAQEAADKRIRIAELEMEAKIRAAKGEAFAIKSAREEFKTKKQEIQNPRGEVREFDSSKANETLEQVKLQRLIDLEEKYREIRAKGRYKDLDDTTAYEKEKAAIEKQFEDAKLGNEELEFGQTADVLAKKLQAHKSTNEKILEDEREHMAKMGELIQMSLDQLGTLFNGFADIQAQKRDNQLTRLQQNKDNELEIVGDNELRKSQIENEYDAKSRRLKREQAKADKAQALYTIALNTAMAITSILSTGGGTRYADFGISAGILTAIVLGQGLLQAGLVVAKPLPAYFKGTKNSAAGPAQIAEKGPEIIEKNGVMSLIEKPSIVNLEKGSIVHTAEQTKKMLAEAEARSLNLEFNNSVALGTKGLQAAKQPATTTQSAYSELAPLFGDVVHAVKTQEQVAINFTKEGIDFQVKKGAAWTQYENSRYYRGKK